MTASWTASHPDNMLMAAAPHAFDTRPPPPAGVASSDGLDAVALFAGLPPAPSAATPMLAVGLPPAVPLLHAPMVYGAIPRGPSAPTVRIRRGGSVSARAMVTAIAICGSLALVAAMASFLIYASASRSAPSATLSVADTR